jgi:hypothetical protein
MRINSMFTIRVLAFLILASGMTSCSGGSSTPGGGSGFTPVNPTGQWEMQGVDSAGNVTVIETNLAVNSATSFFANASNVIVIDGVNSGSQVLLENLGLACDNDTTGYDSLDGTFTSATETNFIFSDKGPAGSFQITGGITFNQGATNVTSGQYSSPAACGVAADTGTITGVKVAPFSGTYAGTLNGGADVVIVTVTEDTNTYSFTASGTDNGAEFNLTGNAMGGAWTASGTFAGQSTTVVGVYDPTGNDFLVYSYPGLTFEGYLNAGSNPAAAVKPHKFVGRHQ